MYGNGCAGSTASGVSTGKMRCSKTSARYILSSAPRSSQLTSWTPLCGELGHQDVEQHLLLLDHEAFDVRADRGELLTRSQPADRGAGHAGRNLVLQRRDADLEELVEIGRADRHELQAFEQRDPGLLRPEPARGG